MEPKKGENMEPKRRGRDEWETKWETSRSGRDEWETKWTQKYSNIFNEVYYLMDPLLVPRLIIKTRLRSGNSCRNNSKRENKVFYTRM